MMARTHDQFSLKVLSQRSQASQASERKIRQKACNEAKLNVLKGQFDLAEATR